MKKGSSGFSAILVVVLILLVIGAVGGAYYLGTQKGTGFSLSSLQTPMASPIPEDPTLTWKTYSNADLSFKYPLNWSLSGYVITSESPKIRLVVTPSNSTLMNECMQETSVETKENLTVRKFKSVTSGEMCVGGDPTSREIWVIPKVGDYAPGISYEYSSTESAGAEATLDLILSTFKFTD